MHKFKVYFEIYGKKLCVNIDAKSEIDAKNKIKEKIYFNKIERTFYDSNYENARNLAGENYRDKNTDDLMNMFSDIFGGKK